MKKMIVFLGVIFLLTACETGTKYKKSEESLDIYPSGVVKKNPTIAELVAGPKAIQKGYYDPHNDSLNQDDGYEYRAVQSFEGGIVTNGLKVKAIRKGRHQNYERLVFDVKAGQEERDIAQVGYYSATYDPSKKLISVVMGGYGGFTGTLPTFYSDSMIQQIYFEKYHDENGYKLYIKLKRATDVKIFDLKSPARMVFDIKSI